MEVSDAGLVKPEQAASARPEPVKPKIDVVGKNPREILENFTSKNTEASDNEIPEALTPGNVFSFMLENPPALTEKPDPNGRYTEVHLDPTTGQIFVLPEMSPYSVHWASVSGEHSMTELKGLTPTEKKLFPRLPFSTKTVVAKGYIATNNDGGIVLKLQPYYRKEAIQSLGDNHGVSNETRFKALLTEEKEDLGLAAIDEFETLGMNDAKSIETVIEEDKIPEFDSDLVRYERIEGNGVKSGVVVFDVYNDPRMRAIKQHDGALEKVTARSQGEIMYDIYEAPTQLHQDVLTAFEPDIDDITKNRFLSPQQELKVAGKDMKVAGRHTLYTNGEGSIVLMINGEGIQEDQSALKDFEFGFFSTYLEKLKEGNNLSNMRLSVSYSGQGLPMFKHIELSQQDIKEGFIQKLYGEV